MSGSSSHMPCPACGGTLYTSSDYKPLDYISGECDSCGLSYFTKYVRNTLEHVNERRIEMEIKPLKKLKKIRPAFTKYFGKLP